VDLILLNPSALGYHSHSQMARRMTEKWLGDNEICPYCGGELKHFENNRPVADFYCENCKEEFELKSKKSKTAQVRKVADGAYYAKIARLNADNNPNLFFMTYLDNLTVANLLLVPRYYFTEDVIERRNPLKPTAQRAGWIGSNILLSLVPEEGKIWLIRDKVPVTRDKILTKIKATNFLKTKSVAERGWMLDILNCVNAIKKAEFSLDDVYRFEPMLAEIHSDNHHIKDKIRQQLQVLRDHGALEFLGGGQYRRKI
jgi:type II restriction enzyme